MPQEIIRDAFCKHVVDPNYVFHSVAPRDETGLGESGDYASQTGSARFTQQILMQRNVA